MELDFDKEIDNLLRQTARDDSAFIGENSPSAHLDADEISAFAEDALPEKAKARCVAHLADCDSCRKSLSELIQLNGESAPEPIAEEKKIIAASPALPWYRKFFASPNLAYTLGALVLAFTGLTAFIVLQNFSARNSEVAQVENTSPPSEDRNAGAMSANINSSTLAMNSNSVISNSTMNEPNDSFKMESKPREIETPFVDTNELNKPRAVDRARVDDLDSAESSDAARNTSPTLNQSKEEKSGDNNDIVTPQDAPLPKSAPVGVSRDSKTSEREDSLEMSGDQVKKSVNRDLESLPLNGRSTKKLSTESRQISGKTFNLRENVWYDSAYKNQSTINIRRGTPEYRNLDSGLRSIAENLSGIIVVVWKERAFRIQ